LVDTIGRQLVIIHLVSSRLSRDPIRRQNPNKLSV